LETFEERVREGTAPVRVVDRRSVLGTVGSAVGGVGYVMGGGGSFEWPLLVLLLGFVFTAASRRGGAISSSSARVSRGT
ncbi:MAG: hypothetical protein ACRETT_09280, partial [Steroidobacteraceae bacterium]